MPAVTVTISYLRDKGMTLIYDPDGLT